MTEIACAECGGLFATKGSGNRYRFCSSDCRHIQYRKNNREKLNAAARKHQGAKRDSRRNLICVQCRLPYKAARRDQSFCSVPCRDRNLRITNPEWRAERCEKAKITGREWHRKTRQHAPAKVLLEGVKKRAKKRNTPFDLTLEWATARWTGRCELTNIPFELGRTKLGPFSPSVDKINPAKGYIQENCRIILLAINWMKSSGTDAQMYAVAEALLKNRIC